MLTYRRKYLNENDKEDILKRKGKRNIKYKNGRKI